jgi:hypothetical protein
MSRIRNVQLAFFSAVLISQSNLSAFADGDHCVDWSKLNLSPSQKTQIESLESQWNKDYNEIKPIILDEQHHLTKLLADHTSDPVEIMSVQQSIARKKEQLNGMATANFLKKRAVLNDNQQYSLELMVRNAVALRQRAMSPGGQTEVMPDHIQSLMQRVRNIWPSSQ